MEFVDMPEIKTLSDLLDNCCSNYADWENPKAPEVVVTLESHCLEFKVTYNVNTKEILSVQGRDC